MVPPGGGAWPPCEEAVVFSNFADQRLYLQERGDEPHPITPEPSAATALRYADGRTTPDRLPGQSTTTRGREDDCELRDSSGCWTGAT